MWHGGTVFLHIFTFCVSVCGGNCEPKVFSFGVVCPTQGWMAKFVCMSFKGDWKYLKQIFNLKRNMNAPKLCFACMAEKTGDMNMTNISQDAPWRETIWNCPLPWRVRPALSYLDFFHVQKISYDMLHVWHLGIGRDLILACNNMFCEIKGEISFHFLFR